MKHRAPAYAGVVLGVVALASSFAEPMAFANGSSGPTAAITVTCQGQGELLVGDTYSGYPGSVRGVDFVTGISSEINDAVKGRSGEAMQGFNRSNVPGPTDWGTVSVQLLGQSGKVIAGSTLVWENGASFIC